MQYRRALLSIVAGVLTGLAVFASLGLLSTDRFVRIVFLGTGVLLAVGIGAWQPIHPLLYGSTLALTLFAVPLALISGGSGGNLGGLVFIVSATFGLVLGGAAAAVGSLLHRLKLARWTAPGAVATAVIILVVAIVWSRENQHEYSSKLLERIQEIRRAELAYS